MALKAHMEKGKGPTFAHMVVVVVVGVSDPTKI
mgnify:CR=1 FL=1